MTGPVEDSGACAAGGEALRGRVRIDDVGVMGAAGDSSSTASDDKNLTVEATAPHQPDEGAVAVVGEWS